MRRAPLLIIAATLLLTALAWPQLPETMAIHWGIDRRADGFAPRSFAAWSVPAIQLLTVLFLGWLLPRAVPGKDAAPVRAIEIIVAMIAGFLFIVQAAILASALGFGVDVVQVIVVAIGAMFIVIGLQLASIPRNPWIGIRTPWTIRDERVWARTHGMAGRVFVIGGVAMGLTVLLVPDYTFLVLILGVFLIAIGPIAYSYVTRNE